MQIVDWGAEIADIKGICCIPIQDSIVLTVKLRIREIDETGKCWVEDWEICRGEKIKKIKATFVRYFVEFVVRSQRAVRLVL